MIEVEEAGTEFVEVVSGRSEGAVLHAGSRAVHLITREGTLLLLGRTALAPFAAGLGDRFPAFSERVSRGRSFTCEGGVLRVNGVQVRLPGHCRIKERNTGPDPNAIRGGNVGLARRLVVLLSSGVIDDRGWGLLEELESAVRGLRDAAPDDLIGLLLGFAGMGPGMTPAADDYLLGVLRALDHLGLECRSETVAETVRRRSTLISAKIVEHALHGCHFYALDELLGALSGDAEAVMDGVIGALRLGSSSGAFMAMGLLDALALLRIG